MFCLMCLKLLICLTAYGSVSSTRTGDAEFLQKRVHSLIIKNDTNTTAVIYMNTGADFEPIVATFENSLPPLSLCGANNDRCNILVTSNADKLIRVVLLPLESGIGLVSFDFSTLDDSLVYRDQFLVSQGIPDCTFVFFVEELQVIIGYCLKSEPAKLYAFRIRVNFTSLNASTIIRREGTSEVLELLNNIAKLSNFVYFIRHEFDGCFQNERNHVIFLDQGELVDHSFMDERFLFPHISIDSSCSRLHRVGGECGLATHCDGRVVLFDTREHIEQVSITEAEYGQTFFCRSGEFVGFEGETLSLYDKSCQPVGNQVSFPFGKIRRGRCVNVKDNFFFVAIIDSNSTSTILVNFSDATYQHLGSSDLSTMVPARVKGDIAIVNNGSMSEVYNLGLMCTPEPLLVHEGNFVLATFFTSETMDQYRCLDRGPSPTEVTITTPVPATSTPTFASDPVNNHTNSSQNIIGGAIAGTVVFVVLLIALISIISCVCILVRINKRKARSPADYGLADLRPESPMPHPGKSDQDVNKTDGVDQRSGSAVESFESQESQGTLEPLLNSQQTNTLNFDPHLAVADQQNIPRLDCVEDVSTVKQTVYENHHSSRDQLAGSLRQSDSAELILGACGNVKPVPCSSPLHSPRRKGGAGFSEVPESQSGYPRPTVAYQGNDGRLQLSELYRAGHFDRPCSSVDVDEGSCNAAGYMQPIQEEWNEHCGRGCMIGVQPPNTNFDTHDVKQVYNGLDSKMNEQGYRAHVDTITNDDSQSQNSEPNDDNLPLDRQRSNDSQENEN